MKLRDFMAVFDDGWVVVMNYYMNDKLFATYWAKDWATKYLPSYAEKEVIQINAYPASGKEPAVIDDDFPVECGDTIFYVQVAD